MNRFFYWLMSLGMRLEALVNPAERVLQEAGLGAGMRVLDFGCGPGRYTLPAARNVGESGRVFALDVEPLALREVERGARRRGLANVTTLRADGRIGLEDGAVDVVLLYNVLHHVEERERVARELRRVLKPGGLLSFHDFRIRRQEAEALFDGLFRLEQAGRETLSFRPWT
jgi:ubiquinone/menaquinone biosynthesis C-methylase UbiE